jgi:hypothetical protein
MSRTRKDSKNDQRRESKAGSRSLKEDVPYREEALYAIDRPLSEAELSYYQHYTGLTRSWLN